MAETIEELDLEKLFGARQPFVLRVRGDSMVNDHLCDGDYVVVEPQTVAKNGQHVVALKDTGETTLCRWQQIGDTVTLIKANPSFASVELPASQVRIRGVVIGVLRTYR